MLRQVDNSFSFENMVYLWAVHTSGNLFFARLGGDMGGLDSPPVTRFGSSTEADLGIFHAHSKPFWFDPVTLWDLPLAALQPGGAENALRFSMHILKSLFDLTLFGFWAGEIPPLKMRILDKFRAWLLLEPFWCDPVRRDLRVAQKRLITRSLRHDQGQLLDCHDSSSNKANSPDDQNVADADHHCPQPSAQYA